jgi:hypothetical protein
LLHRQDRGVASLLLLFAMSAFSVLGITALTTSLVDAPAGTSLPVMRGVHDESSLTRFVGAPVTVPESWRVDGGSGSYTFELGVLVPLNGNEDGGASAALHSMNASEVPGLSVCCESRSGACSQRNSGNGAVEIVDWTPGADNARWMSFGLDSQPHSDAKADVITATIVAAAAEMKGDATPIACQLEYQGNVIAKGIAHLRQQPRADGLTLRTDKVEGTLDIAVRTK